MRSKLPLFLFIFVNSYLNLPLEQINKAQPTTNEEELDDNPNAFKNLTAEEIKKPMTPPILDFKELVKPDQWVNIPIPLTKAFQYLIENEAWQE